MFRLWCKIFENTHLIKDTVIENNNPALSRTAKILDGLESACYEFNLGKPMWLDSNIKTFSPANLVDKNTNLLKVYRENAKDIENRYSRVNALRRPSLGDVNSNE